MHRALLLALATLLSACATQPPPRPSSARHRRRHHRVHALPAAPATPAAGLRCAPVLAANRQLLARTFRSQEHSLPDRWPVLQAFSTCLDAGRGAWAFRLESVREERIEGALELTGAWSLVFLSDGPELSLRPWSEGSVGPEVNLTCTDGDECTDIPAPTAYDHDRDGVAEISVVVERARTVGGVAVSSGFGRLWSVHDGAIEPYGPASELVVAEHRDGDGDGVPDVFAYGPYTAEAPGPCGRGSWPLHGPALMAHALPDGRFSLDDAAARAAHTRTCGEALTDASYHDALVHAARAVVCARLHGRDAATALREMRAIPRPDAPRCRRGTPDDRDVLTDWARSAPWIPPATP